MKSPLGDVVDKLKSLAADGDSSDEDFIAAFGNDVPRKVDSVEKILAGG